MSRLAVVILNIFLLVVFSAVDRAQSAERRGEQPQTLRIAYVAPVTTMAPIWIAAETGAYEREGLDVKIIYLEAKVAVAALVAGEVDAVTMSAPGLIPAVLSGAKVTFIAGLHHKMI
ncbi:MAG: ABC transporter substrate-binding protein, partial [Deltaproteobacteria bacterium]|nr:ABC transporter substrate-binding protein [Deltaproteobacteria bacterium]